MLTKKRFSAARAYRSLKLNLMRLRASSTRWNMANSIWDRKLGFGINNRIARAGRLSLLEGLNPAYGIIADDSECKTRSGH